MKIYVSLTSIYQKQKQLLETLKSIKNQTLQPNKCYIFLSVESYLLDLGFKNKKLNKNLQDYIDNNDIFEIKWCKNIGPYRKLLPLLKEKWNEDCIILTMDDDIYYNINLIKQAVNDYNQYKCCIAYRGFTPNIDNINLKTLTYAKGKLNCKKHLYNFGNNGVGTVHHPTFYHKTGSLVFNLDYIYKYCRTTDDIWFYLCRIVNNIETYLNIDFVNYFTFNFEDHLNTALCHNYNFKNNTNEKNLKLVANKFTELNLYT